MRKRTGEFIVVAMMVAAVGGCTIDGSPSAAPSSSAGPASTVQCAYPDAADPFAKIPTAAPPGVPEDQRIAALKQIGELKAGAAKKRSAPKPDSSAAAEGEVVWTIATNRGVIGATLIRHNAACNVNAVVSLTQNRYFDNTECHRLALAQTLRVLQCGDPTATGVGGPGWSSPDEPPKGLEPGSTPESVVYRRGTIAVANANSTYTGVKNSGGSQFFIAIADSPLPAQYAVIGQVSNEGLKVLDTISSGGVIAETAGGVDGKPKLPVTLSTVTVGF
ncbi:putative peptidyl-prolyl cis-trans isomerase [Gordonia effusa NBRC 100432]|uniref:Putative peptidyl-prolyl cis-trans isomerase n=1 Tax=Gordonia effusa NBRC 100432 TaxID=1077974 RepID=H0R1R8_9ACTN|nr:peptidylprolyl isomerase [Gordonia effusa]GAB19019.1 putative peptidyl-prolyl cis-trans isomerase [Gordonia effusa NBRC 100432]